MYALSWPTFNKSAAAMTAFFSYDDFLEKAREFHGSASPGLMMGCSMVELALHSMGRTQHYHALCETARDLPDAVQLLTACTAGNGRLHVFELGRFALTLYRVQGGRGVRVHLDAAKTAGWPHIRRWVLGEACRDEKDLVRLEHEIRKAGISLFSASAVQMKDVFLEEAPRDVMTLCIGCGEAHPAWMGPLCRACAGRSPYVPRLPAVRYESEV